jgi:2-amino-4-hydroxy-6-hydroxymethyldihydropteridine diphosphokinase
MHNIWLLVGSNIDPARHLPQAIREIAHLVKVCAVSSVWQSPPADQSDQPKFWNAALLAKTDAPPETIQLLIIQPIEKSLRRERTEDKFGPRTIDIDLMLYDSQVGTFGGRQLPHPDILTRAFAAIPLAEISPNFVHPVRGLPLREIAAQFPDRNSIDRLAIKLEF